MIPSKDLWALAVIGTVVFGGYLFIEYLLDDDQEEKGNPELRTRTKTRTGSRDLSDSASRSNKVVNDSLPNFSETTEITKSRSTGPSSSLKSLTSRKTLTSITPLKESSIRKYPSDYYTMNKKQQWKFRKRLYSLHNAA